MVTVSAYASDGEDGLLGYILILTPSQFTNRNTIAIQIPDPASPSSSAPSAYDISTTNSSISISATDNPYLGTPRTVTCTMTEASLAAQNPNFTAANITRMFNNAVTASNNFKANQKPYQHLYAEYLNGACTGISVY